MKKVIAFIQAAIVAAGMLALVSCDSEDDSTYDVTIKWTISQLPICESANLNSLPEALQDPSVAGTDDNKIIVDNIVVKVFEDITDTEQPPIREVTLACSGSGNSYLISGLESGTYDVKVEGMSTYDNDGVELPYYQGTAEIIAADEDVTKIPLDLVNGSAKVIWDFDFGMCSAQDPEIEKVKITLFGEELGATYTAENIPCDDSFIIHEDMEWDIYHAEIEGYDASNTLTYTGTSESLKVRPGEVASFEVTLEAN